MYCDCGEKISEQSYKQSLKFRKDAILCGDCLELWAGSKNISLKKNGRPRKRFQTSKIEAGQFSIIELAKMFDCHRNTIYRRLKTDETFRRAYREGKLNEWSKREKRLKLSNLFFQTLDDLSDSQMKQIYKILKLWHKENSHKEQK